MRIAWTGAAVGGVEAGSVAVLAAQILGALLARGIEVDIYYPGVAASVPTELREHPGLTIVDEPVAWERDRWYSGNRVTMLVSSFAARAWTQTRLSARLVRNHRRRGYDCVFQFSQTELLLLGLTRRWLPPLVVQPSTTAAGELRWHKRESRYARESEGLRLHLVARLYLHLRSAIQRRQLGRTAVVVGASEVFLRQIREDYGIPAERTRLLRHPVDLDLFARVGRPARTPDRPLTLLFASRLSVRKGLELIAALSHRIDDLAGTAGIYLLGGPSMWSDYSGHLEDVNPRTAQHVTHVPMEAMPEVYEQVDAVLAPSHYEPFSLVAAEALAAGIPVVVSDQIGAGEGVDPRVCRIFPAGDLDAFEREVRGLVAELGSAEAVAELAGIARAEARRLFSAADVGRELEAILASAGR